MWRDSSRRLSVRELRFDGFDDRKICDSRVPQLLGCLLSLRWLWTNEFDACA